MRRALLSTLLLLPLLLCAQSFTAENHDNIYIALQWQDVEGSPTLQRRFSFDAEWHTLSPLSGNAYHDTLRRSLCHDTVRYRLLLPSDTLLAQAPFTDALPTTAPLPHVCQIDSAATAITLRWHPAPDPDMLGYVLCRRDNADGPWLAFDTLWHPSDTLLTLADDPLQPHYYRIYAFDSCLTASAMTEPFGNIVLSVESNPCSSTVQAAWSPYTGMEVAAYRAEIVPLVGSQPQPTLYSTTTALSASLTVPSNATAALVTVIALERDGLRTARSNSVRCTFATGDTAAYLRVVAASVEEDNSAVRLSFEVDPSYAAAAYTLYRSIDAAPYQPIAQLPPSNTGTLAYTDPHVSPATSILAYRLGATDGCGRNEKLSSPLSPMLLTASRPTDDGPILLSWSAYGDAPYHLYRRMGEAWQQIATLQGETSFEDPVEHPSHTLYYRVECDNAWSNTASIRLPAHLWIPTAFTPENATNNRYCLSVSGITLYDLTLYNRIGLAVWHSDDPSQCWDGRLPNGIPAPMGAYTYCLSFTDNLGNPQIYKGTLTLIR